MVRIKIDKIAKCNFTFNKAFNKALVLIKFAVLIFLINSSHLIHQ